MFGLSITYEPPRWAIMWALALAIYGFAKVYSWAHRSKKPVPIWRHVGYLLAWPGMDVEAFLHGLPSARPTLGEWCFAISKTAGGVALLWVATSKLDASDAMLVGWTGLLALVFALHFGLFHLSSCAWRTAGVDAAPIMNWPIVACSLGEFWGRRWNVAFHDLTYRFIFRPLTPWMGARSAVMASFLISGLIHDLVISVPAGGGYGLPTLYFAGQGALALFGRSRWARALRVDRGLGGWLLSFVALVAPLSLLFHERFIRRVIVPFVHVLGG